MEKAWPLLYESCQIAETLLTMTYKNDMGQDLTKKYWTISDQHVTRPNENDYHYQNAAAICLLLYY